MQTLREGAGMITRDWHDCYVRDWNGTLHPDAYVHPAKVAYGLAERIYNHCLAQGYFKPGDTVLDPFFGVGGFAFHALLNGLNVVGVELEANFVELARKNLDLWRGKYGPGVAVLDDLRARGKLAPYGAATVLQGDSRQLRQVVAGAQGAVSSPPYLESPIASYDGSMGDTYRKTGQTPRQRHGGILPSEQYNKANPSNLGNLPPGDFTSVIGSPPYADSVHDGNGIDADKLTGNTAGKHSQAFNEGYGRTEGQLGAMHAVSSPPYADGAQHTGGPTADTTGQGGVIRFVDYGDSAGQLGRMHSVSSPPWQQNGANLGDVADTKGMRQEISQRSHGRDAAYGVTGGQLGNDTTDDFWSAASLIMSEVAAVLPPGAFAVWVCKRFVRDGAIVEFSQQWATLGEHHGFETVEWIRAWLVEEQAGQMTLEGDVKRKTRERKSFFRRLAESKGSPRVDWEDVIIQVRR